MKQQTQECTETKGGLDSTNGKKTSTWVNMYTSFSFKVSAVRIHKLVENPLHPPPSPSPRFPLFLASDIGTYVTNTCTPVAERRKAVERGGWGLRRLDDPNRRNTEIKVVHKLSLICVYRLLPEPLSKCVLVESPVSKAASDICTYLYGIWSFKSLLKVSCFWRREHILQRLFWKNLLHPSLS